MTSQSNIMRIDIDGWAEANPLDHHSPAVKYGIVNRLKTFRGSRNKVVYPATLRLSNEHEKKPYPKMSELLLLRQKKIKVYFAIVIATLIFILFNLRYSKLPASKLIIPDINGTKTTIVLMGYYPERSSNLNRIFEAYSQMNNLIDQVLFLWNNCDEPSPPIPSFLARSKVPITLLQQSENSMNNRFGVDVIKNARTSSVLLVDDDIILSSGLIQAMIGGWIESDKVAEKRPIVGIDNDARTAGGGNYLFPCSAWQGWFYLQQNCFMMPFSSTLMNYMPYQKNLVIGKTMLFSKFYLNVYLRDESVVNFVKNHFCEDVLMNAVIRNVTERRGPVLISEHNMHTGGGSKIAPSSRFDTLSQDVGLSKLTVANLFGAWGRRRRECVKFSEEHFGSDIWDEVAPTSPTI